MEYKTGTLPFRLLGTYFYDFSCGANLNGQGSETPALQAGVWSITPEPAAQGSNPGRTPSCLCDLEPKSLNIPEHQAITASGLEVS